MSIYLICYDIADDVLRRQLSNLLGEYGNRVQWSVFEVSLESENERLALEHRVKELLKDEGRVRFYHLCKNCMDSSFDLTGEQVGEILSPVTII